MTLETMKPARRSTGDTSATIAAIALGLALAGAFLLVDPRAEAAFDAPKRLAMLAGIVAASVALLLGSRPVFEWRWAELSRPARVAAILAGVALGGAAVAALLAPRQAAALDALRAVALVGLLLPLGATRALGGARGGTLLGVFVGAAAVSGAMATGQATGLWAGVRVESIAGRSAAFGLVGNEGVLAIALAFATLGAAAPWLAPASRRARIAAALALPLILAGLASAANLTGLVALLIGAFVLVVVVIPRRALPAIAALLAGAAVLAALPPVRARLGGLAANLRAGRLDAVTSNRLAPWAAAVEMVRARPLLGFGPGTFGAEFASHRVAAELRQRRRMVHPKITSGFGEAHCEPLHAAAELGVPAAIAALGALVALAWAAAAALGRAGPRRIEIAVLLAILAAGTVAALLWFPLQRPVTALPLLLAAGRLWRLGGGDA